MEIKFTLTDEEAKAMEDDFGEEIPLPGVEPIVVPLEDKIIELIFHQIIRPTVARQERYAAVDKVDNYIKASPEDKATIDAILDKYDEVKL